MGKNSDRTLDVTGEIFSTLTDSETIDHEEEACSDLGAWTIDPSHLEEERGMQILIEAVWLYKSLMTGVLLNRRMEVLKDVSDSTGITIPVILYALKFGTARTHELFAKRPSVSTEEPLPKPEPVPSYNTDG